MAKKLYLTPGEFTLPPETITQGGSYIVDPVAGKATRVAFTKTAEELAAEDSSAPAAAAITETTGG